MMVYQVTFKDGESIELDETRGEIIKKAWLDGKRIPFEFENNGYLVSDIKRVRKQPKRDLITPKHHLAEGSRCKGKRPIQLEIAKRIKRDFPSNWPEPMRDKDMKNTYRLEILEEGNGEWCDFVAGTCVCEKMKAEGKGVSSWNDVFPGSLNTLREE